LEENMVATSICQTNIGPWNLLVI